MILFIEHKMPNVTIFLHMEKKWNSLRHSVIYKKSFVNYLFSTLFMHPISTCNIILLLQLLRPSISPQLLLYFNTQISSSGAWELGGKLLSQKSLRSKVFTLHSPRCSIWSNKQLWQVYGIITLLVGLTIIINYL